jgi:hypothetical protein
MIKEEKPTGFSEIDFKIFWKNILLESFIIHHSSFITHDIIIKN